MVTLLLRNCDLGEVQSFPWLISGSQDLCVAWRVPASSFCWSVSPEMDSVSLICVLRQNPPGLAQAMFLNVCFFCLAILQIACKPATHNPCFHAMAHPFFPPSLSSSFLPPFVPSPLPSSPSFSSLPLTHLFLQGNAGVSLG